MKTRHFAAAALTALCATTTLTSCLDTDTGDTYDIYESVIVKGSSESAYLLGESTGNIYKPINSTVLGDLKMTDGSYYKRAVVGISLQDGQTITTAGSTYTITGITVSSTINYKSFNTQPDTLSTDTPFYNLEYSNTKPWARYGYVNVPFTFNVASAALNQIHLYAYKAEADTLFTRLQFTGNLGSYHISDYVSFEMPFTSAQFQQYYFDLEPKNDSIVIKIEAQGENSTVLEATTKYKYTER